ncbi:SYS1 [Acanthosepion pharaonis]|uniref:SYS1 n=1 Tax=Acanthosepion pharaonis TaxID=158019 RepID=A0A812EWB2_ACAPH|nr:SYS1 [Sepia pharaonis]
MVVVHGPNLLSGRLLFLCRPSQVTMLTPYGPVIQPKTQQGIWWPVGVKIVMLGLVRRKLTNMHGHFRSSVWDPVLIIAQIICMQCVYYTSAGFWLYFTSYVGNFDRRLSQIFTQSDLDLWEGTGRTNAIGFALNSLTCAFGLRFIVQRTKQCLDFAATVHLIHFICCWSYNSRVPHNIYWWVTNIISLILMTVIGEFLCLRSEMKAIPVSMGPKADL